MTLPDGLRLRRAHPQDLDDIMWLEHVSFPTDAWSASQMSGELYSPHGYYIVIETVDDTTVPLVVGYAGLSSLAGNPVADVQTIAVAADQRGKGLGRVLFSELLDEARRRGVHEVFLEVRADNPVAQAMYAAFGFERIATRPRYYQPDGVDAWVMRAELPDAADPVQPTSAVGPIGQEALDERG
ncbi:ribosomal protein S18-alanine N-acetyltransferase [Curtobacterium sp. VKM Ac-1393]|uniref:ribosomal protein S18-alanine N-acetyltransferase n=1 Tax=Curtobacterium sp. VKM Ac-1393 TaxID=2783814 RepID=UPI00188B5454|nr:ribosomal protein S18-alanine N-acetyltransferase [Curtobacterium sp. VKM Ac-1393]MBF4607974.1 ribosomal protein S18-alanine N-acetyltransferase [Curtobacterium sp. VKM Ac-1393]